MARQAQARLRRWWFQVHKWIGILLALAIIPISLTGAALVWHDWLDDSLNPQRRVEAAASLPPSAYAAAATRALAPGERLSSIAYPKGEGPVVVTLARPPVPGGGRPVRTILYLDPRDGRLLDRTASDAGPVRFLHVLHGSLMIPEVGRQVVGWIGVAMLLSSVTGLWLWWPLTGSLARGLRWRRRTDVNSNLHHQMGFWIALPLFMLSATGVWISFPPFFAAISGASAPPSGADRARQMAAQPLAAPRIAPDRALAAAAPLAPGPLASIGWPTDQAPEWKLAFQRDGGNAEIKVDDATGQVTPPSPPKPETLARTMRRWHDGTGMGPVWQVIIFIGGILPALLAVTGILMWLRSRSWRADVARRSRRRSESVPAE
jgi:uncharacterized iron-regulated membrane protein